MGELSSSDDHYQGMLITQSSHHKIILCLEFLYITSNLQRVYAGLLKSHIERKFQSATWIRATEATSSSVHTPFS